MCKMLYECPVLSFPSDQLIVGVCCIRLFLIFLFACLLTCFNHQTDPDDSLVTLLTSHGE